MLRRYVIFEMHKAIVTVIALLELLSVSKNVFAKTFYCSDIPVDIYILQDRVTNWQMRTVNLGQRYYSHNATCEFVIKTMAHHRLRLKVEMSDLYTPEAFVRSYCEGYDHVDVKDGNDKLLVRWCGRDYPKEIISQDSNLKVVFKSGRGNRLGRFYQYQGVRINVQTFDNSTCPPGWLDSGNTCYAYTLTRRTWQSAQQECVYRQSNLISLNSQDTLTSINQEMLNKTREMYLWTGLNGLVKKGQLRWIDKSAPKAIAGLSIPKLEESRPCGVIHTKLISLYMRDCKMATLYGLCQASKRTSTPLYTIPLSLLDDSSSRDQSSSTSAQVAVALVATACVLLVLAAAVWAVVQHKEDVYSACPSQCQTYIVE